MLMSDQEDPASDPDAARLGDRRAAGSGRHPRMRGARLDAATGPIRTPATAPSISLRIRRPACRPRCRRRHRGGVGRDRRYVPRVPARRLTLGSAFCAHDRSN